MAVSSSSIQHIAPCLSLPFDWQTLSKWFCLPHTLHVWPHTGHICDLSPDPTPPCWWLLQPLHAFWSHDPVPLTAAKINNFEWTYYRFEQSMKMRSGEPWDLTSVWLGPLAYQVVCQGLCWKTQDMYWWWNTGWLRLCNYIAGYWSMQWVFVNISQSILNFWNCCEVISELSWGSFAVGSTKGFLVDLSMASMLPIVLMPSSLSIIWSSIWRLSLVISLLENVCV